MREGRRARGDRERDAADRRTRELPQTMIDREQLSVRYAAPGLAARSQSAVRLGSFSSRYSARPGEARVRPQLPSAEPTGEPTLW
jgi:hypothetical protein